MKLTPQAISRIKNRAKDLLNDENIWFSRTQFDYLRAIVDMGLIPCYKCMKEIEVNSDYEAVHKTVLKHTGRKYFHPICLEALYH